MKKIICAAFMGLCCLTGAVTGYAAEQTQSPNWYKDVDGSWKVRDDLGNIVTNAWFCDLDGSWYLMDEIGCMREGIINDGGHYYSLETSHAGHYGMMRTINGEYEGVNLTFNQEHNGYYGEILSGAQELINTGVKVTEVSGLPSNSVNAKDFMNGKSDSLGQVQREEQQQQITSNPDDVQPKTNVGNQLTGEAKPGDLSGAEDALVNFDRNRF